MNPARRGPPARVPSSGNWTKRIRSARGSLSSSAHTLHLARRRCGPATCDGAQTGRRCAGNFDLEPAPDAAPAARRVNPRSRTLSIGTILLIVLILILVGALPSWPHSRSWGYGPSGIVGVVALVLVVLLLMGRI